MAPKALCPSLAALALAGCLRPSVVPEQAPRQPAAADSADAGAPPAPPPPPPDHSKEAQALSAEAHALFIAEGELLWKRWTTGAGPLPAQAAAEHGRLFQAESLKILQAAAAEAKDEHTRTALVLLHGQLAAEAVARVAAAEASALEKARGALSFSLEGEGKPEHERDLDKLLLEEPAAAKRAAIAVAEARAAAELQPLAQKRDAAFAAAIGQLGLQAWPELIRELHGASPDELAALAEATLRETDGVAQRAVADSAARNLGLTADRVHRADLPRLLRVTSADAEFQPGQGYTLAKSVLPASALDRVQLDAEPRPSKGARPLALLIDPPRDVRLSYRGVGGLDEARAMLHESARAAGGALTAPEQPWELSQLGDGAGAEGAAQLFEELAGDPRWLREATSLRGEQLDDLVHTQATRRLLSARRAAALVLFEVQRRKRELPEGELAQLYRGLLQRATFALYTDEDARRWPLEAEAWIRSAAALQGELLAAQLELVLRYEAGDRTGAAGELEEEEGDAPAGPTAPAANAAAPLWWRSPRAGALLREIWSLGRSASAEDVLRAIDMSELDAGLFAAVAEEQLDYRAPERPPEPPKPDYKEMRDDRRRRKKKIKKRRRKS